MEIIQVLTSVIGGSIVIRTLLSVIQNFVLPCAANDFIINLAIRQACSFINIRFQLFTGLERLVDPWHIWGVCFAAIEGGRTSSTALVFFQSPQPEQTRITTAGAGLHATAL